MESNLNVKIDSEIKNRVVKEARKNKVQIGRIVEDIFKEWIEKLDKSEVKKK